MSTAIAEVKQGALAAQSTGRMAVADIISHVATVQEVMRAVMKKDVHFGVIPGTDKPTLLKPGAEVLCMAFRIADSYQVEDLSEGSTVRYRVTCIGTHQTTGTMLGTGMGEASSGEEKYKWRKAWDDEFDATPENLRRIKKGKYTMKQVRTEPADLANTILKMANKRAKMAMVLNVIRSVNRDLKNDQDFADAEKAVKWCDDIEKRVAGAKQHALSQTATIDTLFKTMDDISAEARQVRLDLEKLVKARKVSLKTEMLTEAQTALGDHIRSLNARLGRDYMPHVPVDFAGAIASKRNFDSMRAALDATLANAKIAANATADKIDANLKVLREQGKDHGFLFHDVSQIVLKAPDDLQALVKLRISEHQAEVARKEEETRERIRGEEKAKLERDQAAAAQKLIDDAAAAAATQAAMQDLIDTGTGITKMTAVLGDADDAPVMIVERIPPANVVPMRAAAPVPAAAPATPPTMKLGDINALLSPINLTAEGLVKLGFPHAATDKSAKLYHARDLTNICAALHDLLDRVQAKQAA